MDDYFDDDWGDDESISEALTLADAGRWREFTDWLHGFSAPDDLSDQLVDEAISLARSGDLKGAADRLRLYTNPKFASVKQCQAKYNKAMGRS